MFEKILEKNLKENEDELGKFGENFRLFWEVLG